MAARIGSRILRLSTAICLGGAVGFATQTPATAGFFERLFGGFHHHRHYQPPNNVQSFADPFNDDAPVVRRRRSDNEPSSGHCVRLSDGFHFPVQAQGDASAADMCRTLCPASPTKVYYGGSIDDAVAADGSYYDDLDTAFLYRTKLVAGSTCNGRSAFGLAHVEAAADPTLRPGDIVATRNGLVAVARSNGRAAELVPVGNDRAIPKREREQLSAVKIMPTATGVDRRPVTTGSAAHDDDNRSVQLSR